MASLRRLPKSPFWIACFKLPDGRYTQRSTKATDKRDALRIAYEFEKVSRDAQQGRLTETQARRVISDIYALVNRDQLASSSIQDFFDSWLKRKELEAGELTHVRYASIVRQFLSFLGRKRTSQNITHITSKEITTFRDHLAKRLTPNSVNLSLKVIKSALGQARRDGLIDFNEAERVDLLKRVKPFERRPFTLPELKQILEVANEEWRGMILVELYTGLRLGDIASLTWANIDLEHREIKITTGKTGRRVVLPIARSVSSYLEGLPVTDNPKQPVFPNACEQSTNYGGILSKQFYQILASTGLVKPRTHASTGKGRSEKREQNELSFHCLRHTATSLLKNAGASDVVARDIIGHESEAISRNYTHIDMETKRKAVDGMPDVFAVHEKLGKQQITDPSGNEIEVAVKAN